MDTPPEKGAAPWSPRHSASLAFTATAVALVAARPQGADLWVIPALAACTGLLAGIFHARRLTALLGGAVGGLALGLAASVDLLRYDVAGKFQAVAATIAVSLAIGLGIGAFVQMVLFVHGATHPNRRRVRDARDGGPGAGAPGGGASQ